MNRTETMQLPLGNDITDDENANEQERWSRYQQELEDAQQQGALAEKAAVYDAVSAPGTGIAATDPLSPCRHDGWTVERQRSFFAAIADGRTVREACAIVGMSNASAYAFRRRCGGSAFALGWQAATLLARDAVADLLYERAIEGVEEVVVSANGRTVYRRRYDHRLGLALLNRLDRQAEKLLSGGGELAPAATAVEVIAAHWDAFAAMIDSNTDASATNAFVDAHRPAAPLANEENGEPGQLRQLRPEDAEFDSEISDPMAAAASALHTEILGHVFESAETGAYKTKLAPPDDFDGEARGNWGDEDYMRSLTPHETATVKRSLAALGRHIAWSAHQQLTAAQAETAAMFDAFDAQAEDLVEWLGLDHSSEQKTTVPKA
jgi:hypothetical protein